MAFLGHGSAIVGSNVLVLESFGDDGEVRHRERGAGDAKDAGAQVGDLLLDVDVGALHDGHDGDQGGDTHRQAEDGEGRAELMGSDGVR